jgi:deazaflavin-dependent oxidoreductase (nitroreductase family)
VAHPVVTVELGAERFQARASVAEGQERERLFAQHAALMPGFAEYQQKTTRQIPVIVLTRIG